MPERRNAVKVLLFLDVGGSMDDHVRVCEELFSAARSEFKHLEHFYFHNFLYENVWKDNRRRHSAVADTDRRVLRTYGTDYRVIFVGDATMSPYEITQPGGSVEHWNEESGRGVDAADRRARFRAWCGSIRSRASAGTTRPSVRITRELVGERMFPLTLGGLDAAIRELKRPLGTAAAATGGVAATPVTLPSPPARPILGGGTARTMDD